MSDIMFPQSKVRVVNPYPITYKFRVKSEFAGKTLLNLMATKFPFHGAHIWEHKILNGHVGLNGTKAHAEIILCPQDEVYHFNPKVIEPAVPDQVEVLQQTDDFLIVYKPAPLPMHPGGRYNKNSLISILADKGFNDLRIVHRLDSVTSGIVLFARNKEFSQQAMHCFSQGSVKKTYYALVSGIPAENTITINAPIRRKNGFVFESGFGLKASKEAITHFEVVKRKKDSAVVKCLPQTGRTHQIRLHLERWGHPIIDDPIYGIDGDKSSRNAQKVAISLLNAGLEIESLGIKAELDIPENWIQSC